MWYEEWEPTASVMQNLQASTAAGLLRVEESLCGSRDAVTSGARSGCPLRQGRGGLAVCCCLQPEHSLLSNATCPETGDVTALPGEETRALQLFFTARNRHCKGRWDLPRTHPHGLCRFGEHSKDWCFSPEILAEAPQDRPYSCLNPLWKQTGGYFDFEV